MRIKFFAFAFFFVAPVEAFAKCDGIMQQQPLNACIAREAANDEAGMNSLLGALLKIISPEGQKALRDTQSAWSIYRDKTCNLESMPVEGGSLRPMVYGNCNKELIKDRIKRLKYYLTCDDGDASCVRTL